MTSTESFPLEARVILHGLVKAPDLNGKVGIVKSGVTNDRQHVYIDELAKSVGLKISNLKYQGRSVDSLSVKELKKVLKFKNVPDSEMTGIDKSELQSKVSNLTNEPEEIGEWLAKARDLKPPFSVPTVTSSQASQAADQLGNMSPDQLRQQAATMRSMDPDTLRRTNPQLAHMTNEQIQMAANQMEMMASNPQMMKMASEKMKNMSPEEIQRMQRTGQSSSPAASSSTPAPTPTADQGGQAAQMMANMTPEQLKQQADMLKSMDPDSVRRMNPQLAHMTDEQIQMAANQFEMMASNPDMVKMAMDQMKNMSPEQVEAMQNGNAPPDINQMGGDPAKMLASMDKKQLKSMLNSMKENPEMMKQFTAMSGMNEEQLQKGVEMFANMEDGKLDAALSVMVKAQKAKVMWTQADAKTGGHLMKIVVVLAILVVVLFVKWLWFSGGGVPAEMTKLTDIPDIPTIVKTTVDEDEFASEF
jgi:hypothetical protein